MRKNWFLRFVCPAASAYVIIPFCEPTSYSNLLMKSPAVKYWATWLVGSALSWGVHSVGDPPQHLTGSHASMMGATQSSR